MGGNAIQMESECPYAQDGKACKHMAVGLYRHSEELKSPAESQLQSVADCDKGRKGFIDYYAADEFILDLRAFLETDARIMVDRSLSKLQIRDYEKQKKNIYRVIKDEEHYREQLWKLVEEYSPIDIELYRELRGLYDEKSWLELRERIISSVRDFQSRNEFLEEEKLYDRLLDSVLQSPGLYTLRQYDDVLGELYPVQILEKYRQQLNQMAGMMLVAAAGIVFCGRKLYKSR